MSDDTIPPPEVRFKVTLLSMANIISSEVTLASAKARCGINNEIILLGIEFINAYKDVEIIEGFIDRSYNENFSYWDDILSKNNDFFLDKKNSSLLFGELSSGIIDGFIDLINEKRTSAHLVETLWKYLHVLVRISISYIFLQRNPQVVKTDDGFSIKYTNNSRSYINLEKEAEKWNVDLLRVK